MAFSAMPGLPTSGVSDQELRLLAAVKQNIEELTGQLGNTGYNAVVAGQITTAQIANLNAQDVNISGSGYTISGASVASAADVVSLARNVQQLVYDVRLLRDTLNTLIGQLQR
jgi:hypothetical protein